MLKIAICDDDSVLVKNLAEIINRLLQKENLEYKHDIFTNGIEFLKTCELEGYNYNIILLDIMMDGLNGIEVGKKIKEKNPECEIIFVTSNPEYVFESFDANPFYYIVKPVDEEILKTQLDKIIEKIGFFENAKKYITIKRKGLFVLINPKDIIYIDANNRILTIHCTYDNISFHGKIDEILKEINEISNFNFIKPHRSYIVNPYFIQKIDKLKMLLSNGEMIPISRLKYQEIKEEIVEIMLI